MIDTHKTVYPKGKPLSVSTIKTNILYYNQVLRELDIKKIVLKNNIADLEDKLNGLESK